MATGKSTFRGGQALAVALLAGHWTCDLQVAVSIPVWASLRILWLLASYLYPCASLTKHFHLVQAKGVISSAGKVIMGLVESNGSLPPGLWLMSSAG